MLRKGIGRTAPALTHAPGPNVQSFWATNAYTQYGKGIAMRNRGSKVCLSHSPPLPDHVLVGCVVGAVVWVIGKRSNLCGR